jgi:hypothetical protein
MFLAGETPPAGDLGDDLARKVKELNVGYVVVHPELLEPQRLSDVMRLLAGLPDLERLDSPSGAIAFRMLRRD